MDLKDSLVVEDEECLRTGGLGETGLSWTKGGVQRFSKERIIDEKITGR